MADRIKDYQINYNILSDASQAAKGFEQLLSYINQLNGKKIVDGKAEAQGLTALRAEAKNVISDFNQIRELSNIKITLDLSVFRSQIGIIQNTFKELAGQIRNVMTTAVSGTGEQFSSARNAMDKNVFDTSILSHYRKELANVESQIRNVKDGIAKANQSVVDAKKNIGSISGVTADQLQDEKKANKSVVSGTQAILNSRKEELEALAEKQREIKSKIAEIEKNAPKIPTNVVAPTPPSPKSSSSIIPNGVNKAISNIPKFEDEYKKAYADVLKKKRQLLSSPSTVDQATLSRLQSEYQEQFDRVARLEQIKAAGPMPEEVKRLTNRQESELQGYLNSRKVGVKAENIWRRDNLGPLHTFKDENDLRNAYKQQQKRLKFEKWLRATGGEEFDQAEYDEAKRILQEREAALNRASATNIPNLKETEEYKRARLYQKRLAAARTIKGQADAIRAAIPQPAPVPPLEPLIGAAPPPKLLEQAFTGKLTLMPDIAAAKQQIAAEKFSANLNLIPMISELRTKLNSETFKVNIAPQIVQNTGKGKGKNAQSTSVISAVQEEINALKNTAKAPITLDTKLDRGGLLGRAQSGYNTLQTLANRHPITYKLASDGSGGFSLNQALARLTEIARTRPVPFRMVHDGSGGFSLNQALARLAEIARTRPVPFRMAHDGSGGFSLNQALIRLSDIARTRPIPFRMIADGSGGFSLTQSLSRLQTLANTRPITISSTINANTIKSTGAVNVPLKGVLYKKNITLPSTPIQVKVAANITGGGNKNFGLNVNTLGLDTKVAQIEKLHAAWKQLPRSGSRTYTINLKTMGLEKLGVLERLLQLVGKLPPSERRVYNISSKAGDESQRRNAGNGGGRGGSIGGGMSGGRVYNRNNDDLYTRARAWAYPFTGNTSFGARTPAALDMIKGMGMMTGIGGAMGVISGSFSDAVGYQNTMETAKAILKDNYKGNNFNRDYDEMVRVVRDVAMRTKFTAPEAADAARFMAMAGLDIPMIKSAIAPIADVAAISDTDLGMVADKMTNIMTEFKVAPDQMRNLADMMTKTFTSTNTDMMMLAESLQYAGPMAFASGQSLAETLAMIGIMGNSGIQASMAGTTMRMMLQNLYNPNKNQAKFMDSIGLKTRDSNGNRRSLFDILSDIARLTGSNDSKNIVGNLLSGKDEKNNIDTFDAASKLFRVTAAAGGASLLGNIDKVGQLIQQIQGASGNSAAVSIAKQNTVAGMWAQAKSAFTEAVVKVFEDNDVQKLLRDTLGNLIEYLKQPEFIDNIRKISDLIVNVMDVLKTVVEGWMWIYNKFGGIVNEVIKWQFIFTNIGYALTPIIQLIGLISTFGGTMRGLFGVGAASKLASVARSGGMAANASMATGTISNAMLFGGLSAQEAIARHNDAIVKYQQKQWRLRNTVNGSAMPGMFWSMAYTNPEQVAMRSRGAIRAEQAAARHAAEINRIRQAEALGLGYMFANGKSPSSMEIMKEWSKQQNSNIRRKPELFTRYERIYGHSYNSNLFGRNSRTVAAFAAGMNAFSFTSLIRSITESIKGIFTSVALNIAKFAGMLASPVGLVITALAGLATATWAYTKNIEKKRKEYIATKERNQEVSGLTAANIGHRQTKQIDAYRRKIGLMSLNGELKLSDRHYAEGNFKVDPLLKNNRAVSSFFRSDGRISNDQMKDYIRLAQDMSPIIFGRRYTDVDIIKRYVGLSSNNEFVKKDVALAAAALAGANSSFAQKAAAPIIARLEKWTQITDQEQSAKEWDSIMSQAKNVAEKYNPTGKNFIDLKGKSSAEIGNMRTSYVANSLQYQQGIYQSLLEINDPNNPIYGSYAALHELRNLTETGTARVLELIGRIAGEINFTLPDVAGVQQELNLKFQNGMLPFENFAARLASLGIKVPNQITAYLDMIRSIYNAMDSGMKGAVGTLGDYTLSVMGGGYTREQLQNMTKEESDNLRAIERDYILNNPNVKAAIEKKYGSVHDWYQSGRQLNEVDANKALKWHQNMMNGGLSPAPVPVKTQPKTTSPTVQVPAIPKPTASLGLPSIESLNDGYKPSYTASVQPTPTTVIHIDKLMDVQGMTIASDAEERQLANVMEGKIEQALDLLKGQIMHGLQSQPVA